MSMLLDLSPQVEAQLAASAREKGINPTMIVEELVSEYLPSVLSSVEQARRERLMSEIIEERERLGLYNRLSVPDAENQAVIDLLTSWDEEDFTEDPEELERRGEETKQFLQNLQANRLTLPVPEL